jgi:hypothetical protein
LNLPMAFPSLIHRLARLGLVGINGFPSFEITGTLGMEIILKSKVKVPFRNTIKMSCLTTLYQ